MGFLSITQTAENGVYLGDEFRFYAAKDESLVQQKSDHIGQSPMMQLDQRMRE